VFVVQVVRIQAGCLGNPAGCENPLILKQTHRDKEIRFGTKSGSFPAGGGSLLSFSMHKVVIDSPAGPAVRTGVSQLRG